MAESAQSSQQPMGPDSIQEERFVHLLKELNETVETIRQTSSRASLTSLIATAVAPSDANTTQGIPSLAITKCTVCENHSLYQDKPVEARPESNGRSKAGSSSNTRLQPDHNESHASDSREARIQALSDELDHRNEAYRRLSAAHRAVLIRLEHCQRLLTPGGRAASSMIGSETARHSNNPDENEQREKCEQDALLVASPTLSIERQEQADQPLSSQVQFVSAKQIRHAKRPFKKVKTEQQDEVLEHVKRESQPVNTPELKRSGTLAIASLDLDTVDGPKSTPRKLRPLPMDAPDIMHELPRPHSAPHSNRPLLTTSGLCDARTWEMDFAEPPSKQHMQAELPRLQGMSVPLQIFDPIDTHSSVEGPQLANSAGGELRSSSSARQILGERDPNSRQTPYNYTFKDAKRSGKRKRTDHGASKICDLAEDYDSESPSGNRANKGRRLQSLLGGSTTPSTRPPQILNQGIAHAHLNVIKPTNGDFYDLTVPEMVGNGEVENGGTRSHASKKGIGSVGSERRMRLNLDSAPVEQNAKEPYGGSIRDGRTADQRRDSRFIQERGKSPPGFWSADMPTTQELEALHKQSTTD